ncbi:hypothetical protein ACFLZX_06310 [Nanoarchaeota archaeon]
MKKLIILMVLLLSVSSAYAICGDGRINGNELCDVSDLDEKDCSDFEYAKGVLGCDNECTFNLSGCFNLENSTCEEIFSEEKAEVCDQNADGGYSCLTTGGNDSNAYDFCIQSDGLIIHSPYNQIFTQRRIPLHFQAYDEGEIYYSVNGRRLRRLCRGCDVYERTKNFRIGPNNLLVRFEKGNQTLEKTAWFTLSRPNKVNSRRTYWHGTPITGILATGYSDFRLSKTRNRQHPGLVYFTKTRINIRADNLPQIEGNYTIWLFNDTDFLKLGNLNVNRREQRSIYRTSIKGYLRGTVEENLVDKYDGALLEVEPTGYDLPYPTTETLLWFNRTPRTNFLENGEACINGRQCQSGQCVDEICV